MRSSKQLRQQLLLPSSVERHVRAVDSREVCYNFFHLVHACAAEHLFVDSKPHCSLSSCYWGMCTEQSMVLQAML
jgi:hypothetical protein